MLQHWGFQIRQSYFYERCLRWLTNWSADDVDLVQACSKYTWPWWKLRTTSFARRHHPINIRGRPRTLRIYVVGPGNGLGYIGVGRSSHYFTPDPWELTGAFVVRRSQEERWTVSWNRGVMSWQRLWLFDFTQRAEESAPLSPCRRSSTSPTRQYPFKIGGDIFFWLIERGCATHHGPIRNSEKQHGTALRKACALRPRRTLCYFHLYTHIALKIYIHIRHQFSSISHDTFFVDFLPYNTCFVGVLRLKNLTTWPQYLFFQDSIGSL